MAPNGAADEPPAAETRSVRVTDRVEPRRPAVRAGTGSAPPTLPRQGRLPRRCQGRSVGSNDWFVPPAREGTPLLTGRFMRRNRFPPARVPRRGTAAPGEPTPRRVRPSPPPERHERLSIRIPLFSPPGYLIQILCNLRLGLHLRRLACIIPPGDRWATLYARSPHLF